MDVLIITDLYPVTDDPGDHRRTLALHQLAKHWTGHARVVVIRPVYIYLSEILRGKGPRSAWNAFDKEIFVRDNVTVIVFPVFKIPRATYYNASLYRYLDRYCRENSFNPGVVVAHFDKSLELGLEYSRRRNLPLVAGVHIAPDLVDDDPAPFKQRCQSVLEAAQAIACRSRFIHDQIAEWFPHLQEKQFIAFSGVEDSLVQPPGTGLKKLKQWKTDGKPLRLITVSSLIPRKKIGDLLFALSLLSTEIPWTFTIIGDGELREHLEKMARKLGIRDNVNFLGTQPRETVVRELKKSHIFMLISRYETFGLAYLEAMATGNIVIGSRDEGIDGVIRDKENGLLCDAGDHEQLHRVLERIIHRMSLQQLQELVKQSHATIREYTETRAAASYWNHILEAVASHAGGASHAGEASHAPGEK